MQILKLTACVIFLGLTSAHSAESKKTSASAVITKQSSSPQRPSEKYKLDVSCQHTWAKFVSAAARKDKAEMTACFMGAANYSAGNKIFNMSEGQLAQLSKMKEVQYVRMQGPVAEYITSHTDAAGRLIDQTVFFVEDSYGACKINIMTQFAFTAK